MSISWNIENYASLPSTQDVILLRAMQDAEEGLVIQTMTQTAGRGRHGNEWDSPMGGLYMSVLLKPECNADQAAQLSFVVAVALSKALDNYITEDHKKELKWPNDILVDGKKIAGILLESDIDFKGHVHALSAGIGVNILSAPEGAVCLKDICDPDKRIAINPFRDDVLAVLDEFYTLWQDKGFAPIREKWLGQAHGIGEKITVRLPDKTFEGIFKGVKSNGSLLVETDKETVTVNSGEVHFRTNENT